MDWLFFLVYLFMGFIFFSEWLDYFLADEEMTRNMRLFSGIILIIATLLWPVVVPISYLEILKFHKKHKVVIDLLRSSKSVLYKKE